MDSNESDIDLLVRILSKKELDPGSRTRVPGITQNTRSKKLGDTISGGNEFWGQWKAVKWPYSVELDLTKWEIYRVENIRYTKLF